MVLLSFGRDPTAGTYAPVFLRPFLRIRASGAENRFPTPV